MLTRIMYFNYSIYVFKKILHTSQRSTSSCQLTLNLSLSDINDIYKRLFIVLHYSNNVQYIHDSIHVFLEKLHISQRSSSTCQFTYNLSHSELCRDSV